MKCERKQTAMLREKIRMFDIDCLWKHVVTENVRIKHAHTEYVRKENVRTDDVSTECTASMLTACKYNI